MRNIKFVRLALLLIVGIAIAVFVILSVVNNRFISPDKTKLEEYFECDKSALLTVVNFFEESGYDETYISIKDGRIYLILEINDLIERKPIEEEIVINAINYLYKSGYKRVGKRGSTIFFDKWRMGEDVYGIAYLIDDSKYIDVQFIVYSESLSELGWYCYEANYNEWRVNHQVQSEQSGDG